MQCEFNIYLVLSFIVAIILSLKTDKKVLSIIFVFFILAQPILTDKHTIDLPGLPFDLQPNRILLFILPLFLFFSSRSKYSPERLRKEKPLFQIFFYIYFILVIFALALNYTGIQTKNLIIIPSQILLFILLYHVAVRHSTPSVLDAVLNAILLLSVFAAFLAIYQVLVDSSFLRIAKPRYAFGNIVRATAIFSSEYELGFFLNFAIIVLFVRYWGKSLLFVILPLLIIGLVATFHRLNWIIFIVSATSYLFIFKKTRVILVSLFVSIVLSGIILMSYYVTPKQFSNLAQKKPVRQLTSERLFSDTVTVRLEQFLVVADAMSKYPMGLGAYDSKKYYDIMAKHGMIKSDNIPLAVHNGYLAVGIKYGILAMITYSIMLISMARFFKNKISLEIPETTYPFYVVIIWAMANLSNGISNFKMYFILLVAILCGSFVSLYSKEGI